MWTPSNYKERQKAEQRKCARCEMDANEHLYVKGNGDIVGYGTKTSSYTAVACPIRKSPLRRPVRSQELQNRPAQAGEF